MSHRARRVVVVLDGPATPAWQQRTLAGLLRSPELEVAEVRQAGAARRGPLRRAHAAIERRLFALGPDALMPVALEAPHIAGGAATASGTELVVWLSERPLPAEERRELLYLRHNGICEPAEDAFRRAALRGLAIVHTEALIRRDGRALVVEETFSGSRPFSTTLSRDKALWKLAGLVGRAVARAPGRELAAAPNAAGRTPSTAELLVRSPGAWLHVASARVLFRRPWQIRVRERAPNPTEGWSEQRPLVRWRERHLYADPFLFEHAGGHHLFCEDLAPGERRAVISHTELRDDGSQADVPRPVLTAPYHLSYPCVFSHRGEVFMIPETSAERRVELYRAVVFPTEWRRESILLEKVIAADATLLEHDGRLWLFVGIAAPRATMLDELHLFMADALLGPWAAHPRNPIVSDVRCARPAGAIQRWGSRLVRPGQDSSRRYGGAISFRQIDELSSSAYSEHEIGRIDPGDLGAARATHTYACDGRFEAVDLRRRELRVPRVLRT